MSLEEQALGIIMVFTSRIPFSLSFFVPSYILVSAIFTSHPFYEDILQFCHCIDAYSSV